MEYSVAIKELPSDDRPRERLQAYGPTALSNSELLAILISGGYKNFSALNLAQQLLQQEGGLNSLSTRSINDLQKIKGVGLAKASSLLAAFEIGRRLARSSLPDRPQISSPEVAAQILIPKYGYLDKENVGILALDTKNRVIDEKLVSVGIVDSSLIHPREVFRPAISANATSIILFHNHPSSDPSPSPQDRNITERMAEAGKTIGIELLDHIIVGRDSFISLKQKGFM